MQITGWQIRVTGTVQGVGFRPFVWHLAQKYNLCGTVRNDGEGVLIQIWGNAQQIELFYSALASSPPPLAKLESLSKTQLSVQIAPTDFSIVESEAGLTLTNISPDAATCPACLAEINDPANRRYRYPFSNCTHCGPRFSIIKAIPYDRANTSMQAFKMCQRCQAEYDDPADRRFHAQPNACADCGPIVWLEDANASKVQTAPSQDAIAHASSLLRQGYILAIKGLGGFHLACDARNDEAVSRLRQRKQRYAKPFALMARDLHAIKPYAKMSELETALLASPAAPIVLLAATENNALAPSVAPDQNRLGFMLPATPLQHLLLQTWDSPLLMTSGNRTGEAQCIDNVEAREQLKFIADYFLLHNRDIVNRLDDSVAQVVAKEMQLLRRSRGYAPAAITLPSGAENRPAVLAMGGELKNTFCITTKNKAIISQYQGDLEDASVFHAYRKSIELFQRCYKHQAQIIAIDQHPEYLSSKSGRQLAAEQNITLTQIQHHHAHLAACLAEHQFPLNTRPVLGIVLDGLGYGEDGTLWGGEFLLADYQCSTRLARFQPIAMPGGARAMQEPWRNAVAYLHQAGLWQQLSQEYPQLPLVELAKRKSVANLIQMIDKGINCPLASSAGRLFDAVAAILNLCPDAISYEGQAAIQLEQIAEAYFSNSEPFNYAISHNTQLNLQELSWRPMWKLLLNELNKAQAPGYIAARFHRTLVDAITVMVEQLRKNHPFEHVVLSGGVMQNRLLLGELIKVLKQKQLKPLFAQQLPANDGGIALGQAMIALAKQNHFSSQSTP